MATRVESPLYRLSARFLVVFFIFMVLAFWPSYFARLFEQPNFRFHAHGILLTVWCALLFVQPQLLRTGRRGLHRILGKASYVLAPALVAVTLSFVHYRVGAGIRPGAPLVLGDLYFLALTLNALAAFAVLYGLAIYYRRDRQVHGRYMLCTVFPLFTPVTDRLIARHAPELLRFVPHVDGSPLVQVAGFLLADLILVVLALWDWRANQRANVFPVALGVLLLYHVSVVTLPFAPPWGAFCAWFLGLPLS
ncbi:MAG TPA: hypothetical protein VFX89_21295 [Gammaproteobacteria bacterium]|nr:hypothetical protein [Gammaproteobacteria bacterium]